MSRTGPEEPEAEAVAEPDPVEAPAETPEAVAEPVEAAAGTPGADALDATERAAEEPQDDTGQSAAAPVEEPQDNEAPSSVVEAEDEPESAGGAQRRERRVRTLDFSQPTKFTAEFRRRIARLLNPFCDAVANRLSAELRTAVELRPADSSQLTWSAAKAQLPASSIAVALDVHPIEKQMLLNVELPLILQALECLLGGTAAQAPQERRLTEIDWALTRGLLDAMISQLALAWRDLGGLELRLGEVDLEGDAGVFAPIGEPTFSLALECRIDGIPSTMSLLIPWSAIEPVAHDIATGEPSEDGADPREGQAMRRGLAGADVLLRAEIGAVQMPVERMLALTPGTLLELEDRAEDGVRLYAEGVAIGRGRPGLWGTRRAIKLTSTMEPASARRLPATFTRTPSAARPQQAAPDAGADDIAPTLQQIERMRDVPVRVWAELGRATVPLGHALELPAGAVVELDRSAEEPIALFAGGMPFAHGSLLVTGDGEWAVKLETLV